MSEKLLTDDELRAIEERVASATPGPWTHNTYPMDPHPGIYYDVDHGPPNQPDLCFSVTDSLRPVDAVFIAAAREDVPRLLADLHRYRDWCQRLVACENADSDVVEWSHSIGVLTEEVRAALEDKSCTCGEDDGTEPKLPHKTWCPKAEE